MAWLEKTHTQCRQKKFCTVSHSQEKFTEYAYLKIGRQLIQRATYAKFLGILMDEHLTWKYHITELCKKLPRTARIFLKVLHHVPVCTLICIYNSLCSSFLTVELLHGAFPKKHSYLNPLFRLPKKVLRTIKFQPLFATPSPIFHSL